MCGSTNSMMQNEPGVFPDVEWAVTPWRRLRGLAYGRQRAAVLAFPFCRDVHTAGMRQPIDIAFADSQGHVLQSFRGVRGGKRFRCKEACIVIERYADDDIRWPQQGDRLSMCFGLARESED